MNSDLEIFKTIFVSNSKALEMGLVLRKIGKSIFPEADENIAGGAKVKLALYSINSPNQVVYGIQQGAKDTCMLYVHHIDALDHPRLKFSGSGKHAKRIKFTSVEDINTDDIEWLLQQVKKCFKNKS